VKRSRPISGYASLEFPTRTVAPANSDLQEKSSSKKIITLTDQPANAPFSPAILINDTLFISGQLSMNPETGKLEGETMAEQAELVIKNIKLLCNKAGMDLFPPDRQD